MSSWRQYVISNQRPTPRLVFMSLERPSRRFKFSDLCMAKGGAAATTKAILQAIRHFEPVQCAYHDPFLVWIYHIVLVTRHALLFLVLIIIGRLHH